MQEVKIIFKKKIVVGVSISQYLTAATRGRQTLRNSPTGRFWKILVLQWTLRRINTPNNMVWTDNKTTVQLSIHLFSCFTATNILHIKNKQKPEKVSIFAKLKNNSKELQQNKKLTYYLNFKKINISSRPDSLLNGCIKV